MEDFAERTKYGHEILIFVKKNQEHINYFVRIRGYFNDIRVYSKNLNNTLLIEICFLGSMILY